MTLFEKIVAREIPAQIVYEEEDFLAFRDIQPQAPVHILVIPKRCIPRIAEASAGDAELIGRMLLATRKIAEQEGFVESGYRVVINNGPDAGEAVPHLHIHILAKRRLTWPPG